MQRKISVVFSSHLSDEENEQFKKHIKDTIGKVDLFIHCIVNKNEYSLTQAYNMGWKAVEDAGYGDGLIVFCHNDIIFKTPDWGKILFALFSPSRFDILGVAGTTKIYDHGCWWLDEQGQMSKSMVGRVWHTDGLREWESVYTEKTNGIKEVLAVDGLFFVVKGSSSGLLRFDEDFKGFHYYDISFSFENFLDGNDIGVTDRIKIMHKSVGRTNQEWETNRKLFLQKYSEELPKSID